MLLKCVLVCILFVNGRSCYNNLTLISKSRSSNLEKYEGYVNAVIINFEVPRDSVLASFKFVATEQDLSIFGCRPRNISLFLKFGSPPLVNPDGALLPADFKNLTRATIYDMEFMSDEKEVYINISSPDPGHYYAATFLSYTDPRYNAITQQGLSPSCYAFMESTLYVNHIESPTIVAENQLTDVLSNTTSRYFKFFTPDNTDHCILRLQQINLSKSIKQLIVRIQTNKPPSSKNFTTEERLIPGINDTNIIVIPSWVEPNFWHYIEFHVEYDNNTTFDDISLSNLKFTLHFFTNHLSVNPLLPEDTNMTFNEFLYHSDITNVQPYKQYDLVREASSESFTYSFELEPELVYNTLIPINITNQHFSVLKFDLRTNSDVGGTLQYILAFKPRLTRQGARIFHLEQEPKDNIIIGCIHNLKITVPTWPDQCVSRDSVTKSQLVLNSTVTNSTVLVPYPESGVWYATFKLFCGDCQPCNCTDECRSEYETCVQSCETKCYNNDTCDDCASSCKNYIFDKDSCGACDCDGPCLRNDSAICNSSIVFDVSSRSCYYGGCGRNGRCMFMVSEGTVYSTCVCSNRYRGFDCSDATNATPYYLLAIEMFLLVGSNIFFLLAVFIAYKRRYYIQSLCYFAIFFFSTFYHACDAGENILSFCIVRLGPLQFADFFCALLAIWLTLIAIADLPQLGSSLLQMGGAIVLAFCTTIDKTSFWVIALPTSLGILIVMASWYLHYRKFRQRFVHRKYLYIMLPIGVVIVLVDMIIYVLLQTENNYKYLHSMWHVIIASAIIILLPRRNTFQPGALL